LYTICSLMFITQTQTQTHTQREFHLFISLDD
jgi:hypothetical protein